jgi:hypothetical protein
LPRSHKGSILWAEREHLEQCVLYLGHFTFDGERPAGSPAAGPTHGWSTALAEADSPDEARDKFGNLIESLDDEGFDGFHSVQNIYLEDVTEVERLPEGGRTGPLA